MESTLTITENRTRKSHAVILALFEVIFVRALVVALVIGTSSQPVREWQLERFGHIYTSHLIFMLVPVVWLILTRRNLSEYGLNLRNWRADLRTAMSCFLPVAVAGATLGFLPYTQPWGAVVESFVQVGLLFWVAASLRKPDPKSGVLTIFLAAVLFAGIAFWQSLSPTLEQAVFNFLFYLPILGFGEEILYRGYIQTRLNQAFGTPWRFLDVDWGWGIVITSALFGLSHLMNGLNMDTGTFNPQWWWALWTFFGGFVFSYLRQKTGSILAPACVHGLPQALVYFFLRI